jgi:hypothetical protein
MTVEEYYMEVFGEEPPKIFEESDVKHHFDFCKGYAEAYHAEQIKILNIGGVMPCLPSRREMDESIIGIMVDELDVVDNIIANKFSASLKIIAYFESLINKA